MQAAVSGLSRSLSRKEWGTPSAATKPVPTRSAGVRVNADKKQCSVSAFGGRRRHAAVQGQRYQQALLALKPGASSSCTPASLWLQHSGARRTTSRRSSHALIPAIPPSPAAVAAAQDAAALRWRPARSVVTCHSKASTPAPRQPVAKSSASATLLLAASARLTHLSQTVRSSRSSRPVTSHTRCHIASVASVARTT